MSLQPSDGEDGVLPNKPKTDSEICQLSMWIDAQWLLSNVPTSIEVDQNLDIHDKTDKR